MILVQKTSSLAFSVHDGMGRKDEELTEEQRKSAIRRKPTPLEYFAYVFSFNTLMCGPLVYYVDFIDFINGQNFKRHVKEGEKVPAPSHAVLTKLFISTFFAISVVLVLPLVPPEKMVDDKFIATSSMLTLVLYMVLFTSVARFKYFFAWRLGETICNASGLGFNGFDKEGSADWELVSNINIWRLETSLNFKILLDNWNKTTQSWLRRYAYERVRNNRVLITYILSAVWHGFYPGYYLCFLTAALVTTAARHGRRCLRPRFKGPNSSPALGIFYDVITFILTRVYLAYSTAPFVLLSMEAGLKMYRSMYFFGHILCVLAIVVLPKALPPPPVSRDEATKPELKVPIVQKKLD
jgi:lysophospholipid acyltransferase 1/2